MADAHAIPPAAFGHLVKEISEDGRTGSGGFRWEKDALFALQATVHVLVMFFEMTYSAILIISLIRRNHLAIHAKR